MQAGPPSPRVVAPSPGKTLRTTILSLSCHDATHGPAQVLHESECSVSRTQRQLAGTSHEWRCSFGVVSSAGYSSIPRRDRAARLLSRFNSRLSGRRSHSSRAGFHRERSYPFRGSTRLYFRGSLFESCDKAAWQRAPDWNRRSTHLELTGDSVFKHRSSRFCSDDELVQERSIVSPGAVQTLEGNRMSPRGDGEHSRGVAVVSRT
jgi:hypothetical protein